MYHQKLTKNQSKFVNINFNIVAHVCCISFCWPYITSAKNACHIKNVKFRYNREFQLHGNNCHSNKECIVLQISNLREKSVFNKMHI